MARGKKPIQEQEVFLSESREGEDDENGEDGTELDEAEKLANRRKRKN